MSEDYDGDSGSYSETSNQSWFSRLGKAFGGVIVGLILVPVALIVLFWNEGRAVDTARSLAEAGQNVLAVSDDKVDPANEGKLVYTHGNLKAVGPLEDDAFGVEVKDMIQLARILEMYSWRESIKTETKKKLGGGTETKETATYTKEWSKKDKYQDSSKFKRPALHHNPPWPDKYDSKEFTAPKVTVGAFTLSSGLVRQINSAEPLPLKDDDAKKLPDSLQGIFTVQSGVFYKGKPAETAKKKNDADPDPDGKKKKDNDADPDADTGAGPDTETDAAARIGDLKVSYRVIKPHEVSLMAEQSKDSFRPYQPKSASKIIEMLSDGNKSAKQMVSEAEAANTMLTWLIRLGGFIVVAIGIFLFFNPLVVLADVLPILGNFTGFLLGVFAVLVAFVLSFVTIAVAWLTYRPILGIAMLAIAGLALFGVIAVLFKGRGKKAAPGEARGPARETGK
jgi:hypothetical protein